MAAITLNQVSLKMAHQTTFWFSCSTAKSLKRHIWHQEHRKKKKRLFKSVNNLPLLFFPLFLAPCTDTVTREFTCWAHWKILNLDPKTFPGFIFLQRWKQLGRGRGDCRRLHGPCRGLVTRAAAGVTAAEGTRETAGQCRETQRGFN